MGQAKNRGSFEERLANAAPKKRMPSKAERDAAVTIAAAESVSRLLGTMFRSKQNREL